MESDNIFMFEDEDEYDVIDAENDAENDTENDAENDLTQSEYFTTSETQTRRNDNLDNTTAISSSGELEEQKKPSSLVTKTKVTQKNNTKTKSNNTQNHTLNQHTNTKKYGTVTINNVPRYYPVHHNRKLNLTPVQKAIIYGAIAGIILYFITKSRRLKMIKKASKNITEILASQNDTYWPTEEPLERRRIFEGTGQQQQPLYIADELTLEFNKISEELS